MKIIFLCHWHAHWAFVQNARERYNAIRNVVLCKLQLYVMRSVVFLFSLIQFSCNSTRIFERSVISTFETTFLTKDFEDSIIYSNSNKMNRFYNHFYQYNENAGSGFYINTIVVVNKKTLSGYCYQEIVESDSIKRILNFAEICRGRFNGMAYSTNLFDTSLCYYVNYRSGRLDGMCFFQINKKIMLAFYRKGKLAKREVLNSQYYYPLVLPSKLGLEISN